MEQPEEQVVLLMDHGGGLPAYSSAISMSQGLISVDFLPCILPNVRSSSDRPSYEPFQILIQRANQYLLQHPQIAPNTCETVEFATSNNGTNILHNTSTYTCSGEGTNHYIRGLRLWVKRVSSPPDVAPEQIGYYNILPKLIPNVERLDSLMIRINALFHDEPIPGRVITIETQPIKSGFEGPLPDETSWTESRSTITTFVNLLRVFYVVGPPQRTQIGFADFLPRTLKEGGWFERDEIETFPAVLGQARHWLLSVPPNYHPVNAQTVTFRYSREKGFDTMEMVYTEDQLELTYIRYLRIGYLLEDPRDAPVARQTVHLDSKIFVPRLLKEPECFDRGEFEGPLNVRVRLDAWVSATKASVISVESLYMRIGGGGEAAHGFDTMRTWNSTYTTSSGSNSRRERQNESFACLYRVYTTESYADPPGMETDPSLEQFVLRQGQCMNMGCVFGLLFVFVMIAIFFASWFR